MTTAFAVFGNPIKHSKSAEIYALFAREIGISEKYDLKLISPKEVFDDMLFDFFQSGGLGANITVPFKERAFSLCTQLTERARIARSVNTIKKQYSGDLLGDNTDGIGFITDLIDLHWISNSSKNYIRTVEEDKSLSSSTVDILLIGAGGAARGIIFELLTIPQCNLYIVNRTYLRAQSLVQYYCDMGYNNIYCVSLDEFSCNFKYNLVINATNSSVYNDVPHIPPFVINSFTKCYDLFYKKGKTSFLQWCQANGSKNCVDGLGMLIQQAAHSFYLWHDVFPLNVSSVFSYFRSIL